MARRCVLATTHERLHPSLDDGSLDAHRRRLLHRAEGRVLDLSLVWSANLLAYRRGQVESLTVTGRPARDAIPEGLPDPVVLPRGLSDPDLAAGSYDTVVVVFTLCCAKRPAEYLARAAGAMAPGGQILAFEHVAGTGLTRALQRMFAPVEITGASCRLDLDVVAAARTAGLVFTDCARFKLWAAAAVPAPCLAGVLRTQPRPSHPQENDDRP